MSLKYQDPVTEATILRNFDVSTGGPLVKREEDYFQSREYHTPMPKPVLNGYYPLGNKVMGWCKHCNSFAEFADPAVHIERNTIYLSGPVYGSLSALKAVETGRPHKYEDDSNFYVRSLSSIIGTCSECGVTDEVTRPHIGVPKYW